MGDNNKRGIVPHHDPAAKGADIIGFNDFNDEFTGYTYVIRPDLRHYLATPKERDEKSRVLPLHPSLIEGKHYFSMYHFHEGHNKSIPFFYVIVDDTCRRVTDLSTDNDPLTFKLHTNCQGGDHYLGYSSFSPDKFPYAPAYYVIIFQKRGVFRIVSDLSTDAATTAFPKKEYTLHENCKGGIYYWACGGATSFDKRYPLLEIKIAKPVDAFGFRYHSTRNLQSDEGGRTTEQSFPLDLVNFLPGGTSITMGPTNGEWSIVKSFENLNTGESIGWKKAITIKVGHNKSISEELTQKWDIKSEISTQISIKVWTVHCMPYTEAQDSVLHSLSDI